MGLVDGARQDAGTGRLAAGLHCSACLDRPTNGWGTKAAPNHRPILLIASRHSIFVDSPRILARRILPFPPL